MIRRSGQQGVPVIILDDEVVVGFDRRRLEEILARRARPRPTLGARVAGAEAIARKRGISLPPGAYVGGVSSGSPAERAGLREGDVILSLDGRPVQRTADLSRILSRIARGQPTEIRWWRSGQEMDGQLVL